MATTIDWRRVFVWLEAGHRQPDIAAFFGVTRSTLTRSAREQLPPGRLAEYRRLVYRNRNGYKDKCGTPQGHGTHHRRNDLPVCQPCLDAHAEYKRNKARKEGQLTNAQESERRRQLGLGTYKRKGPNLMGKGARNRSQRIREDLEAHRRAQTIGWAADQIALIGQEIERSIPLATLTSVELGRLTRDELRQLAADRNLKGRGSMNKAQLVEALRV